MDSGSRFPMLVRLAVCLLATASLVLPARPQGTRKVVARYVVTGTPQGFAFADGDVKLDDARKQAFQTALKGLTLTLYNDDAFDVQSGPGNFVFSFAGGRVGRGADGLLFLHFRPATVLLPIESLDGILYPAGTDPQAAPPRLTFALAHQLPPSPGVLTWHAVALLKAAGP